VLIVDLRFPTPLYARFDWLRLFLDSPQTTGGSVSRVHEGWNEDNSPGSYRQNWNVRPGSALKPLAAGSALHVPTAFIVNNTSYSQAADVLDVLQSTGRAVVILEQRGAVVLRVPAEKYAEDVAAWLNTSMLLSKSGNLGPQPDSATPDPIDETKLASLAGKLLEERKSRKLTPSRPFSFEMMFPASEPASPEVLSRERRLLGLFKMWTVISYMDLHVQYASIEWATALRDCIPKVEAAESLADYYMVLQRLTAKLNDSHISVVHPSLRTGRILPLRLRPIEG
jgi:hypothetical protein